MSSVLPQERIAPTFALYLQPQGRCQGRRQYVLLPAPASRQAGRHAGCWAGRETERQSLPVVAPPWYKRHKRHSTLGPPAHLCDHAAAAFCSTRWYRSAGAPGTSAARASPNELTKSWVRRSCGEERMPGAGPGGAIEAPRRRRAVSRQGPQLRQGASARQPPARPGAVAQAAPWCAQSIPFHAVRGQTWQAGHSTCIN